MTPELPQNPREKREARLTALLLEELSAQDAAAVRAAIAADPELAKLHARLKLTLGLVREAAASPTESAGEQVTSLKLSDERREKLLAHFKTVTPEFVPEKKRARFGVLEIAAVFAILAVVAAMMLPALSKSKSRSQRVAVLSNLRQIDTAKQMWAEDNNKSGADAPTAEDLKPYLRGELPPPVAGETYTLGKVEENVVANLDPKQVKQMGGRPTLSSGIQRAGREPSVLTVVTHQDIGGFPTSEQEVVSRKLSGEPSASHPATQGGSNVYSLGIVGYVDANLSKGSYAQISKPVAPSSPRTHVVLPSDGGTDEAGKTPEVAFGAAPQNQPAYGGFLVKDHDTSGARGGNQFGLNPVAPEKPAAVDNYAVDAELGDKLLKPESASNPEANRFISRYAWNFEDPAQNRSRTLAEGEVQNGDVLAGRFDANGRGTAEPGTQAGKPVIAEKESLDRSMVKGSSSGFEIVAPATPPPPAPVAQPAIADGIAIAAAPEPPPTVTVLSDEAPIVPAPADVPLRRSAQAGTKPTALAPLSPITRSKPVGVTNIPGRRNAGEAVADITPALHGAEVAGEPGKNLEVRTFKVDPNALKDGLASVSGASVSSTFESQKGAGGGAGNAATKGDQKEPVADATRNYFKALGVDLKTEAGKSIQYDEGKGELVVRGTPQELDMVEAGTELLNRAPLQVTVKAKFADVAQAEAKASDFAWFDNQKATDAKAGTAVGVPASPAGPVAANDFLFDSAPAKPAQKAADADGDDKSAAAGKRYYRLPLGTVVASGGGGGSDTRGKPMEIAGVPLTVDDVSTFTVTLTNGVSNLDVLGEDVPGTNALGYFYTGIPRDDIARRSTAGKNDDGRKLAEGRTEELFLQANATNSANYYNDSIASANGTTVPLLGDLPTMGRLSRSETKPADEVSLRRGRIELPAEIAANTPAPAAPTAGSATLNFSSRLGPLAQSATAAGDPNIAKKIPAPGAEVELRKAVQADPANPAANRYLKLANEARNQEATRRLERENRGTVALTDASSKPAKGLANRSETNKQDLERQIAETQKEVEVLRKKFSISDYDAFGAAPVPSIDVDVVRRLQGEVQSNETSLAEKQKQLADWNKLTPEQQRTASPQTESVAGALMKQIAQLQAASERIKKMVEEARTNDTFRVASGRAYYEAKARLEDLKGRVVSEKPSEDAPIIRKPATNAPIAQPEVATRENAFSTFSLNVSDVSFKLAAASLEKGQMPDTAAIRSEEFINAFDYRDPEAAPGTAIAFAWERARYPFAHNRDLLRFSLKTAAAGRTAGRPLNIVLLLDNSGSMERADRVAIIREALHVLAKQLQPQDRLSVIAFARTPRLWVDGIPGNKAGEVADQLSELTPQGGTNLEEAMKLAYATAARHYLANGVNRVVLLTDGAANLGDVEPDSLKQTVEAQRKQGIALDCFGIGWEGFNDDLLEVLSRNGDGRYGFINSPEEAASDFVGQLAGALQVAASDVKVQVEFNPRRATAYRQIGYAKHQLTKQQFRDNTVDAAEIAAQEAGNALYTAEVNPAGEGPICTVRVRYKIPGTTDYREQEWDVPFNGNAGLLEHASPAMRLAATASAFAEWLAVNPFAGEVTPDRLLGYLSGVPEIYGADARPKKLEWMIRQAKSLEGK